MPGEKAVDKQAISNDRPVGRGEDELGRRAFAKLLATHLALSKSQAGLVMSLTGPWGAGKSSVLAMVAEELDDRAAQGDKLFIVEFNPWFFSGTGQLTAGFLLKLAAVLPKGPKERASEAAAERLRSYAGTLAALRGLPVIGGYASVATDLAAYSAERLDPTAIDLERQRDELAQDLASLDLHIIVLVDDVDRLQTHDEIRQVMQMVKLVGDLPGVTYLLAFDPRPIRAALSSTGISGGEYLEKIVQVQHQLPAVSDERLNEMLDRAVNVAIQRLPDERLDAARWPQVYDDIIRPLVHTPRHVRRLSNALPLAIELAGADVDLVDLIALTAVATFMPTLHEALPSLFEELVAGSRRSWSVQLHDDAKAESKARLKAAASDSGNETVALAVFALLFPHTSSVLDSVVYAGGTALDWKRLRRVAELESLYRYLTALTPEGGVSAVETEALLQATSNDDDFSRYLQARHGDELGKLALRLELHASELDATRIPALARLLNARSGAEFDRFASRPGDPASNIEGAVAALLERLAPHDRHREIQAWFDSETDITGELAVFEIGRRLDKMQQPIAGEQLLDTQLDQIASMVESMSSTERQELSAIGRVFWLTTNHLLPRDLTRLKQLLADDFLFGLFLVHNSEPNFGDGPRRLAWDDLNDAVGKEWLITRLDQLQDPSHLDDHFAELVHSAKNLASQDARSLDSVAAPSRDGSDEDGT